MKKKIITALTVVFAMCLAIGVYAFNQPTPSAKRAADCCAKKDSCPMKDKEAKTEQASCCAEGDHCPMKSNGEKTGAKNCCGSKADSCPMKKDAEKETAASVDMTNVTVVSSVESCCQPGTNCCKGDSCCKDKK